MVIVLCSNAVKSSDFWRFLRFSRVFGDGGNVEKEIVLSSVVE